ncbi:SDR family oxidoreductase [Halobacteriovorax sp. RT-2-4]|uniref:SDR family oxidoreductase n=1 Tax=unclassified Halobacteriovorax TaxID=2639665 RepID=UPI00399B7CD8
MNQFELLKNNLLENQYTWTVTGCAGFIGSNITETLLKLNQKVIGLDNFSTGHQHNLDEIRDSITKEQWDNFSFINGDIRNKETCIKAVEDSDYVIHQAALGSVPRSIADPINTNENNISGFLNMLNASKDAKVKSFTYASSSSVYGDHPDLPKIEHKIGEPLSPYALTKLTNEKYAEVFAKTYGFYAAGLRYFNVFGKRQDPNSAYAAVIPKWTSSLINNDELFINGDGETSRDFCYIENVVQANLLAATTKYKEFPGAFNIALGDRTTLNELLSLLGKHLKNNDILSQSVITKRDFRAGDVRHSQADISKAKTIIGYEPLVRIDEGIQEAVPWYIKQFKG